MTPGNSNKRESAVLDCEALVIGGGPAGATAALLLARAGWSVVVVERKSFPRGKVCGEYLSATNWALLELLDVADSLRAMAGPPVHEVGLCVGKQLVRAELPGSAHAEAGRALSREQLDTLLLDRASAAGAEVRQPCRCLSLEREASGWVCTAANDGGAPQEIRSRIVIAAHGSWDAGPLPTQPTQRPARAHDLFGFKARFRHSGLPDGLMPLVSFPDGYGGLVHSDSGHTSFSCCIRRGRLERLPRSAGEAAGQPLLRYIHATCPVMQTLVREEFREHPWLAAGPIRPGVRQRYRDGIFAVGNTAGEAHPAVAEGISMAMQSAWLLAVRLIAAQNVLHRQAEMDAVGRSYTLAWRRAFLPRIVASAAIAQWAMHPRAVMASLPLVRRWPGLLTFGARLSGKTTRVVPRQKATLR